MYTRFGLGSMLLPLDRFEVDAFLEHFPEGTHVAKAGNGRFHAVDGEVDFFVCREAAETEAEAAVRKLVVEAEVLEHIAGLQAGAGAGAA